MTYRSRHIPEDITEKPEWRTWIIPETFLDNGYYVEYLATQLHKQLSQTVVTNRLSS